jgi:hypothetical protein
MLLRGHQEEGVIVVVAGDGRVLAARNLSMALGLSTVSAETPDGHVVLCNADREWEICDVQILTGRDTTHHFGSEMPSPSVDCLVPRFTKNGGATCFRRAASGIVYRMIDDEGRFSDAPYPEPWLPDDVVRLGPISFIQKWDTLSSWNGHTLEKLQLGGVRWIAKGVGTMFVAICGDSEQPDPNGCRIEEIDGNASRRTIWSSAELAPMAIRQLTADLLIIDASSDDSRELVQVRISDSMPLQKTLWSRSSHPMGSEPSKEPVP